MEQNYLVVGDEEIRIRKVVDSKGKEKLEICIKRGSGLIREEFKEVISPSTYCQLNQLLNYKPIVKVRKEFIIRDDENDLLYEYDEYQNEELKGIRVLEIEFKDKDMEEKFIVPKWLGKEVTGEQEYKNQHIWKRINNL